ncbi:MAG: class I SAM-dependent methyltransferase, partial [Saprospiraceae bacterium]|nr:class I SAM-dependent methyltransferase [Saprospiraceae bacterium]
MDIQKSYDSWSEQYDTNINKSRDLEARSLRETLTNIPFDTCLEMGCGTGKNTAWLLEKAKQITAVDFSDQMLTKARERIIAPRVDFIQADITQPWAFAKPSYDLAVFSLVLEHIQHLDDIFCKLSSVIKPGGYCYIGELHPAKQYNGTKARFDSKEGQQTLTCFMHHLSDFTTPALHHGFSIETIREYFDEDDRTSIPRILTLLFKKQESSLT